MPGQFQVTANPVSLRLAPVPCLKGSTFSTKEPERRARQ